MNHVVLIGRLAADPTVSYTPNTQTAVAAFRLAVSRETKDGGADFIPCKVFGRQAETLQQYKHKGDEIAVHGRIETGSYPNKNGETVYTTEVICNRIEYTHGSKGSDEPKQGAPNKKQYGNSFTEPSVKGMGDMELPDSFEQAEEDLPF